MAQNEHQSTDARPIKPVSSLLSHFEGLKGHVPPARPSERSPVVVRASFDLPRPDSPWNPNTDPTRGQPQTPSAVQRTEKESPSKSGHRRPMSMHIGSSPQLTPAVNVESPRSPPRTFFNRSASRSPDRIDNTPFGKVRELISAHSSRSSSRPPSPEAKANPQLKRGNPEPALPTGIPSSGRSLSPARPPPPVNRAEKPKIPAKPLSVIQTDLVAGRLTPEPPASAITDARVSPFSTPPSSEGSPSPDESIQPTLFSSPQETSAQSEAPSARDPRFLGFNAASIPARANTVGERKLSRDGEPSKRHVSERIHTPVSQARDPRHLGFSKPSVQEEKAKPDQIRIPPPLQPQPQPQPQPISTQARDARQFGFSNSPAREEKPELPVRRAVVAPPPRPSQESKNLPPRRASPQASMVERPRPRSPQATVRDRPRQRSPQATITERPRQKSVPTIPRSALPPSDAPFPPPPKRNTFNGDPPTTPSRSGHGPVPGPGSSIPGPDENQGYVYDSDGAENMPEPGTVRTDYPDATQSNRRPPFNLSGEIEIKTKSDGRVFDICGKYLCVSGYVTRVFDMSTGEQILGLNHGETVKVSSVRFKPSASLEGEGARLWLGSNIGDLQEIDVATHSVVASSLAHNRRDVIKILRYRKEFWTLDDDGKLFVWPADRSGEPNLKGSHVAHKVPRGHTFSMVVNDELWLATGKEVRIYKPGNEATFTALTSPLTQPGFGDVTSGAYSSERGGQIYLGHTDGKISIYSTTKYSYVGSVKVSDYKINCLSYVGDKLWAAYKTGKVYVYDTSSTPWKVRKDWIAHVGPVHNILLDPSSVWTLSRLQVVTAGHDDVARLWDATLEEDWMESAMQERDVEYCTFREVKAAVVTWNVGAAVPGFMREDFVADAIHAEDPPEILAFGFQEVVDLEDKTITARSILGFAKKKDTAKSEHHQSRVYREWRDYLARSIDRCTDVRHSYSEIQTSSLIGLFQCVFIRQQERQNVTNVAAANVKCGMGGHYGNKGALITRFMLDNSSLCFVNCHLAAGQSQTAHRNNDIAAILESEGLPVELNRQLRSSVFVGGGDGTQILDHEICILNGDLNYRIDTVPRDTVIKMIRNNELAKLMERDQLMVCRRRIAGFRLAPFVELPINFAPTYKYDVGTDNYDSSEKKRAPAWCDRLLYRGSGRVKQIEYRRHEVRVSDHRPVSGTFKVRVKRVDAERQERVRQECSKRFQLVKKQMCETVCVGWLVDVMGVAESEARRLIAG